MIATITPMERAQAVLDVEIGKSGAWDYRGAHFDALDRLIEEGDSDACHMLAHIIRKRFGSDREEEAMQQIAEAGL